MQAIKVLEQIKENQNKITDIIKAPNHLPEDSRVILEQMLEDLNEIIVEEFDYLR